MPGQLPPNFGKKPPTQLNVNLDDTTPVQCNHCGCPFFIPALALRELSALVSKSGNKELVVQNVMLCVKCHKPAGSKPDVFS